MSKPIEVNAKTKPNLARTDFSSRIFAVVIDIFCKEEGDKERDEANQDILN